MIDPSIPNDKAPPLNFLWLGLYPETETAALQAVQGPASRLALYYRTPDPISTPALILAMDQGCIVAPSFGFSERMEPGPLVELFRDDFGGMDGLGWIGQLSGAEAFLEELLTLAAPHLKKSPRGGQVALFLREQEPPDPHPFQAMLPNSVTLRLARYSDWPRLFADLHSDYNLQSLSD